jgi:hypothetical protein
MSGGGGGGSHERKHDEGKEQQEDGMFTCVALSSQVRTYNVDSAEAKGPVFARSLGSRMVEDDSSFCMQVADC